MLFAVHKKFMLKNKEGVYTKNLQIRAIGGIFVKFLIQCKLFANKSTTGQIFKKITTLKILEICLFNER